MAHYWRRQVFLSSAKITYKKVLKIDQSTIFNTVDFDKKLKNRWLINKMHE